MSQKPESETGRRVAKLEEEVARLRQQVMDLAARAMAPSNAAFAQDLRMLWAGRRYDGEKTGFLPNAHPFTRVALSLIMSVAIVLAFVITLFVLLSWG